MRIIIEYEASWRNSFLDGSNDEPLPKKGRNFVGSMTELKKPENFLPREISKNTVMGILSRLIGDQRKLYQARQSQDYYFADLEDCIDFKDSPSVVNNEIAYIRNMKGNNDQNSFTGMIKVNDPIFLSDYSYEFWNVLSLTIDELCDFIINDKAITDFKIENPISLDPVAIIERLNQIQSLKYIEINDMIFQSSDLLLSKFNEDKGRLKAYNPKIKNINSKNQIEVMGLYCCAMYLQMQRLENKGFTIPKSAEGGISGISKNGFTEKDFMSNYVTGGKKKIYGNPYIRVEKTPKLGKTNHTLKKASGQLEIILNIEPQKAIELKKMIDNAGVSSFYLGKKGLAYVIEIKEK